MIHSRRRDSAVKRARVLTSLEQMLREGLPITFTSLARHAHVSTWLTYTPGLREAIHAGQARQRRTRDPAEPSADPRTAALRTDLALARAEITRLRAERVQHQQQLRLALGARLDNLAKADLVTRVEELTQHNSELATNAGQQQADNTLLRARVTELEDDLAAARTSLRRMIRAENSTPNT